MKKLIVIALLSILAACGKSNESSSIAAAPGEPAVQAPKYIEGIYVADKDHQGIVFTFHLDGTMTETNGHGQPGKPHKYWIEPNGKIRQPGYIELLSVDADGKISGGAAFGELVKK